MKQIFTLICAACVALSASAYSLIEPPTSLQIKSATANSTSEGWGYTEDYPVSVGRDGSTLYICGLLVDFPDAWIKGEINGGLVTFASGQFIGTFGEEGYSYDMFANGLQNGNVCDFTMTLDETTGNLTSTPGMYLAEMMEFEGQYYSLDKLSNITITVTDNTVRNLVEVPASAVHYDYTAYGYDTLNDTNVEYGASLAFDGDDVYLGKFSMISNVYESYIKGTRQADGSLVFPMGQYIGTDEQGEEEEKVAFHFYVYGAEYDGNVTINDLVLTYNPANDRYSATTGLMVSVNEINSSRIDFIEHLADFILQGDFEYVPTGITSATSPTASSTQTYDLQGRIAKASAKGISIVGGKKVIR